MHLVIASFIIEVFKWVGIDPDPDLESACFYAFFSAILFLIFYFRMRWEYDSKHRDFWALVFRILIPYFLLKSIVKLLIYLFEQEKLNEKPLSSRKPNCFNCKSTLNSAVDNKCFRCGWLKCKCGACGCKFKRY